MAAKTPESARLTVVPLILLPFVSSAIVPAAKTGQGVRQFAEYRPFPSDYRIVAWIARRHPSGGYAAAALAWCAGIALSRAALRVCGNRPAFFGDVHGRLGLAGGEDPAGEPCDSPATAGTLRGMRVSVEQISLSVTVRFIPAAPPGLHWMIIEDGGYLASARCPGRASRMPGHMPATHLDVARTRPGQSGKNPGQT